MDQFSIFSKVKFRKKEFNNLVIFSQKNVNRRFLVKHNICEISVIPCVLFIYFMSSIIMQSGDVQSSRRVSHRCLKQSENSQNATLRYTISVNSTYIAYIHVYIRRFKQCGSYSCAFTVKYVPSLTRLPTLKLSNTTFISLVKFSFGERYKIFQK